SRQGNDFHVWLVDIAAGAKGAYQATLVETAGNMMGASTLKEASVTAGDVRLAFLADGDVFEFRGRFDKGAIRGSMSSEGGILLPARLIPTDLTALKKNEQPAPSPGRRDFLDAAGAEKPFDALLKFVAAHGESPLAIEAYEALVVLSQSQGYTQEQFKKL